MQRCGQRARLASVFVIAALLHACGGGSDEPRRIEAPPPVAAGTMTGTVATGYQGLQGSPVIKGVGRARTFPNEPASGKYSATLQLLDPPYMLQVSGGEDPLVTGVLSSVSTRGGNVNVTPLTTLVSAYAVRQVPDDFFTALGSTNGPDIGVITDASIARGERRVGMLLQDWGVAVPDTVNSFVHDPFVASDRDPMHQLLVRFRAELIARGTSLPQLLKDIGTLQALCRQERVDFSAGVREDEFCPSGRSTSRVDGLDLYRFTAPGNDTLLVRAALDGRIVGVELVDNGTVTYTCIGAACSGITLAAPDAQSRRSVAFAKAVLGRVGGGTPATLDGSLRADALGTPSPQTLSCLGEGGSFHALLSRDNTFPGSCVQAGFAVASGPAARTTYQFTPSGDDSVNVADEALHLRVHTDGAKVLSVSLYSFYDPFDLVRKAQFKCGGPGFAPCTGVVVEPATELNAGSISLDGTVLWRVGADGAAVDGDTATLRAASLLTTPRQISSAPSCEFLPEVVNMTVSDGQPYPFCPDENNGDNFAGPLGEEIMYYSGSYGGAGNLSVYTLPGSLVPVRVEARREGDGVELFVCDQPACLSGVTITRDEDGRTQVRFRNVALRERDLINTAGDRTATLTDGAISFAPFE